MYVGFTGEKNSVFLYLSQIKSDTLNQTESRKPYANCYPKIQLFRFRVFSEATEVI